MSELAPAPDAIASPLNLLRDEVEAREVLLLTYTLNLEFWERYSLSIARGLGARVTVVGDAAMVHGDPAHVRYAGITYLDGRAACQSGGAFHPKLLVIAGEDYATVAIGSGNATVSGWHDNAELWTVLRGDSTGAPNTFVDLAAWLRGLPARVSFSGAVENALERTADLLGRLPAVEPGPRLLTSLDEPILDQLPFSGTVDEIVVASPFYDRRGDALRTLFERFEPRQARVMLQPSDVVADGSVLAGLLTEPGRSAETIAGDRYHHGKLIEWVADGRRLALTGSPNVSAPALRLSLAEQGGNCELALLTEIEESLAPSSGGQFNLDQLAAITFDSRYEAPPAITLLGVMLGPDRLAVTLGRPLDEEALLEYLEGAAWATAAVAPTGVETFDTPVVLAAGTAVRIRRDEIVSNVCFVADPSRFVRARVEHAGRVRTDQEDVFRDPSVADAFAHDLAELRQFLTHTHAPAGGSGGGSGERQHSPVTFTSWEEYLDACEAHIGPRLLAYGLALPGLGSSEGLQEEQETGTLTGETGEEETPEPGESGGAGHTSEETHPPPKFHSLTDYQRRRYQRWCAARRSQPTTSVHRPTRRAQAHPRRRPRRPLLGARTMATSRRLSHEGARRRSRRL